MRRAVGVKSRRQSRDGRPELLHGSPACGAEERSEFRKPQLDGIEAGTVGWQLPQRSAGPFDPLADAVDVMASQVVHDDDIAGTQRGDQDLLDVREKTLAIHSRPWCAPG